MLDTSTPLSCSGDQEETRRGGEKRKRGGGRRIGEQEESRRGGSMLTADLELCDDVGGHLVLLVDLPDCKLPPLASHCYWAEPLQTISFPHLLESQQAVALPGQEVSDHQHVVLVVAGAVGVEARRKFVVNVGVDAKGLGTQDHCDAACRARREEERWGKTNK
eukprot:752316-Hanusia_phi.AAC.1